jgi:hypothetical protein
MKQTRRGLFALIGGIAAAFGFRKTSVAAVAKSEPYIGVRDGIMPQDPELRLAWRTQQFVNRIECELLDSAEYYESPIIMTHCAVACGGHTAADAIDRWYEQLPKGYWTAIIWRNRPVLTEADPDMVKRGYGWVVYSRFSLMPKDAI